jgi:hypothetical protein
MAQSLKVLYTATTHTIVRRRLVGVLLERAASKMKIPFPEDASDDVEVDLCTGPDGFVLRACHNAATSTSRVTSSSAQSPESWS